MSFAAKIKALFSEEVETEQEVTVETEDKTEQKFMDIPVGDRLFRIDTEELMEGSYIFEVVIEEVDGVEQEIIKKVDDGEYTLEDGTVITVVEDTVTTIVAPEETTEETTEEVEEGFKEEEKPSEFELTVFESFEKLKKDFEKLVEINGDLKKEINLLKEDFDNKLEEVKKLPGGEAVSFKKQGFKFNKKEETNYARYQELSKYRK